MKRILLTGASGTVGREVLKQLLGLQPPVEIIVFDKESDLSASFYKGFRGDIKLIYGDLSKKTDVSGACKNIDFVIHLAAIIPPLADKFPKLAEEVNIIGTQNLLECIGEQSPGAFFLYSSSISVYGDRNTNPWIRTTDPLAPSDRDEYARTKIAAEKLITGSRLKWSIFRLTAIMGAYNHKPSELMFHMPLNSKLEIATPADTARAFVNALSHPEELKGNIYNLSGGEHCRIEYRDFISRSFKAVGLGKDNFRENSFASKNFHCGYYEDGDVLNNILDFRRETIEDYFTSLRDSVSPSRRFAASILRWFIKSNIQRQSEPLASIKNGNKTDIEHYF